MKRGAVANLILACTVALLPLYTRVTQLDFNRTSKDNLLIFIFGVLSFVLSARKRSLPKVFLLASLYAIASLVLNQWNVLSISVMMQSFYALSGIVFFMNFYEKHDSETVGYILSGMRAGAVIQAVLVICSHFNFNLYFYLVEVFSGPMDYKGSLGAIGSLGNTNLSGSYLSLTALAFLGRKIRWPIILVVFALLLTKSYMGIGAFLAGVSYWYLTGIDNSKKAKLYFFAISAMFAVYALRLKNGGSGRFDAWDSLFSKVTLKHFVFGMGPGWFADQQIKLTDGWILSQEHNSFLTAFNFFGVALFLFLIPAFLKFIKQTDKNKIFPAIMFAGFCNSFGHFTLHQSTVAVIIVVASAISLGETNGINLDR